MSIDKDKLKALADRVLNERRLCVDEHHLELAEGVQALLAEVGFLLESRAEARADRDGIGDRYDAASIECDQLKAEHELLRLAGESLKSERDQLKAENEALRKQVADLSPFKNAPPQGYRASNKCLACGEYHHGLGNLPCPRCTPVAQSAMAKEASHG